MPGLGFERGDALVVIDKMLQQKLELIVDAGKTLTDGVEFRIQFGIHIVFENFVKGSQ
jgi:hypothetical protein